MSSSYVAPQFQKAAFNCPLCGAYAKMDWSSNETTIYMRACCQHCKQNSLWMVTDHVYSPVKNIIRPLQATMLYPDFGSAPLPKSDMPEDVKQDYEEAARIFSRSPRGAAALLRLALQKLCKHLGEPGENINTDIRALVSKGVFSPQVTKVADTLRITGNNAVHPAQIVDEDFDRVAEKMFDLINFIVKKAITEPKELDELYSLMPENARKAAEERDKKTLENKQS